MEVVGRCGMYCVIFYLNICHLILVDAIVASGGADRDVNIGACHAY